MYPTALTLFRLPGSVTRLTPSLPLLAIPCVSMENSALQHLASPFYHDSPA